MTKVEYVYRSLREEILVGTLPPGKRLLFADLAKRFGVSAIPVREAVRQLESDDLVEFKPHTRVEVKSLPFTEDTLLQVAYAYEQSTDWHTRRPAL